MKQFLIIFLLLCLSGCSVKYISLEEKWRPLEEVVERGKFPYISDGITTTVGSKVFVSDIEKWQKQYPKNSDIYNDLLAHEYVHSYRQFKGDIYDWIGKYIKDKEFRLYEEQLGYYVDIKRKMARGWRIDISRYANALAEGYFGMISKKDALEWVNSVIMGKWKPQSGDLPDHPEIPKD